MTPDACSLADLELRTAARIVKVCASGAMRVQLLEMGFVRGTRVEVLKRAPLGDPLELRVRGYHVCLRAEDAAAVRVERCQ
ncbi:MAG: FeoA family protein [Myxococcota bacterium]